MSDLLFEKFMASGDSLQIHEDDKIIFTSEKSRLLPLFEYLSEFSDGHRQVTIFDKIMGNGAALLAVSTDCREVYSPLGSQPAIATLDKYHIKHHITKVVPYILKSPDSALCPMEKLSLGKTPGEFYDALSALINSPK